MKTIKRIMCVFGKHKCPPETWGLTLVKTEIDDTGSFDFYKLEAKCIHCGKHYQGAIKIPILVATEGFK